MQYTDSSIFHLLLNAHVTLLTRGALIAFSAFCSLGVSCEVCLKSAYQHCNEAKLSTTAPPTPDCVLWAMGQGQLVKSLSVFYQCKRIWDWRIMMRVNDLLIIEFVAQGLGKGTWISGAKESTEDQVVKSSTTSSFCTIMDCGADMECNCHTKLIESTHIAAIGQ